MKRAALLLSLLVGSSALAADKREWIEEKTSAAPAVARARAGLDRKLARLIGKPAAPVVNVWNTWTRETMVLDENVGPDAFNSFLRCHFTGQPATMDLRLLDVLVGAARKFEATRIDIVSGYRSPKYNLVLRKKGREVARDSQHTYGHAVDFRIRGVPTARLVAFVRSLRLGGAGFYPGSGFVHADTGPIRTWAGR